MRAGEGFFTCVSSDMSLQKPRSGEGFAADFADARKRVTPDMHLQGPKADVFLVTVFAAERFSGLRVTVQLLMFGQSSKSRVRLVALVAVELLGFCGRRGRAGGVGGLALIVLTGERREVQGLGVVAGRGDGGLAVVGVGGEEGGK